MDPGSKTNCISLSHFRRLFPQLCSKDGTPKENALEPTLAQFEAYDGGIMTSHGWIILPTWDIRDSNKFHPVRYYVVTREEARILISHTTATWLGLVKVLCPNKVPRIKRQVASVSKKAREPSHSSNSNSLSGSEHPPKVKYFYNNKIMTPPHPPKVKYFPNNSVPKLVIRQVGDTAYDSYIAETLKSAIKLRKQTRFAGDPVSSVKTIPARRTRSHPPKWTIEAEDLDLLIPIELSQARAHSDLIQDLRGDLSVVSPRESHQSEEILPTVPLGQFQAQRSDNTTTNNIAHSQTDTPSQSEINSTITENIVENIVTSQTNTPSQREIFSETGTGTSCSEDMTHSDGDIPKEHLQCTGTQSEHG